MTGRGLPMDGKEINFHFFILNLLLTKDLPPHNRGVLCWSRGRTIFTFEINRLRWTHRLHGLDPPTADFGSTQLTCQYRNEDSADDVLSEFKEEVILNSSKPPQSFLTV